MGSVGLCSARSLKAKELKTLGCGGFKFAAFCARLTLRDFDPILACRIFSEIQGFQKLGWAMGALRVPKFVAKTSC